MYFILTMSVNSVTKQELFSWIGKSIDNIKLKNCEISITGKTEKGDGYMGDIVFVNVSGITNENIKKTLHWVIKHSKKIEHLRKTLPMKAAFDNEIYFYDKVFPAFKQFQIEKNIDDVFESVPKCYDTLTLDNMEVLVLDNLIARGYKLHDKKKTLNMCHLKIILKEYGKLHALSFALRDQKPEEFNKLAYFNKDIVKTDLLKDNLKSGVLKAIDNALKVLREYDELCLSDKFEKLLYKDPADIMLDLIAEKEPQSVIIHGDSWNNNFMFKYQDADKISPTDVSIMDWQISALRSPVMDVAYLIYATSSGHELEKLEELLTFYYTSFANFLKELGSDPEELFSYSFLKAHWKKYSQYALFSVMMVFSVTLCDKEDTVAFEDVQEGDDFIDVMFSNSRNKDIYFERVKSVLSHYFNNPL